MAHTAKALRGNYHASYRRRLHWDDWSPFWDRYTHERPRSVERLITQRVNLLAAHLPPPVVHEIRVPYHTIIVPVRW